jgi:cell division protein FtsL
MTKLKSSHKKMTAPTGSPHLRSALKRGAKEGSLREVTHQRTSNQVNQPNNLGFKIATSLAALTTLVLFTTTMVTTNSLATQGGNSGEIAGQVEKLQIENANLSANLSYLTSVTRIYQQAKALGFKEPDKVLNASQPSPVALKPQ